MTSDFNQRGFTLIETLIGALVFVIVALAAYQAFGAMISAVAFSQAKVAATSVANEKFEIIRNLTYQDVGIIAGIPAGKIARYQNVTRDNYTFNIETTIRNIDDPFDGTIGGNPNDLSPADYKMADLEITCSNCESFNPLSFTTLITPQALETASTNGALFVQVFDAGGQPVPQASVHIVNTQTDPDIIIDETTDNAGWVRLIDAPPGTNAYSLTATKDEYTTDQTYPIGGAAGPNPNNPDITVVVQQVSQAVLSIDRVSSLLVSSVDAACLPLPNIGFSLTGTKLIGAPSVLKYPTQNFTTDGGGSHTINNLEWDTYTALLTGSSYDLAGASLQHNFTLHPNENQNLQIIAVPHVDRALLVLVRDSLGAPLDGASVRLTLNPFDDTKTTPTGGACPTPGQVFWNGLGSGTYTLTVSKAGFQTDVSSVNLSSSWQSKNVSLTPD